MKVRVARTWELTFDESPQHLWTTLADTRAYPRWWPWLQADALPPLVTGARAEITIVPPLPYRLDVVVEVTDVVVEHHATVVVHGDLDGRARLDLVPVRVESGNGATARSGAVGGSGVAGRSGAEPHTVATGAPGAGCLVRLELDLVARRGPGRSTSALVAPFLRLGHDLVMTRGLIQFGRATGLHPTSTRPTVRPRGLKVVVVGAAMGTISAFVLCAARWRHRCRRPE